MKIGPDFEITRDKYQWIVTHWEPGKDRDGNPKRQPRQSYHATLLQACQRVLDALSGEAASGTAQEVIAAVRRAETAICDALKGAQP